MMKSQSIAVVSHGLWCAGARSPNAAYNLALLQRRALEHQNLFESEKFADRFSAQAEIPELKNASKISNCGKMLLAALSQSLLNFNAEILKKYKCGVFLGTSIGGVFETENAIIDNLKNKTKSLSALRYYECSTLAEFVAKKIGASGQCCAFSTACSSSSIAMDAAACAISCGDLDFAVVCGADSLSRITLNGFGSLLLLSKHFSKPFDLNRDGINLGEAGAVLILASQKAVEENSLKVLANISGWGSSCDAHHATAPDPEGMGAFLAIESALKISGNKPISFICAHGTGTAGNDVAEVKALNRAFSSVPSYASLKGIFGHTLGASGLLNAVVAIEAMQNNTAFASTGFSDKDPEITPQPATENAGENLESVLSLSLGFGGNNSCTIFSKFNTAKIDFYEKPCYVYSLGAFSDMGENVTQIFENYGDLSKRQTFAPLKNISPLKKRRWSRHQQILLSAMHECANSLNAETNPKRTGVCLGTGLGMTGETENFLMPILTEGENSAKPLSFTNSVHNAASSLAALSHKLNGINFAVSAKEISFECALKTAINKIKTSAIDAAFVGSSDEYNHFAQEFINAHSIYSHAKPCLSEQAATYYLSKELSNIKPLAKIDFVDISKRAKSPADEAERVGQILANANCKDFVKCFSLMPRNKFAEKITETVSAKFGKFEFLDEKLGSSYSASAFGILAALKNGAKGRYMQYVLSSTNRAAILVFEVL